MEDRNSRPDRSMPDDRRGFSPRTNPNRPSCSAEASGPPAAAASESASAYPARCNPRPPRQPLDREQQQLAVRYMPLARKMAREMADRIPRHAEDWEESALFALVEAAQSFDPSREINFATFARIRINGALLNTWSKLRGRRRRRGACAAPDRGPGGRAQHGTPLLRLGRVEPPVGEELDNHDAVETWTRQLPGREALTLRHIYLEGMSQQQAAAAIGCSEPTMSRVHQHVLKCLREVHALELCA
ncbi:flagellar biosynthesis sigma factor [Aquisphaera giovannonii]|uniref:Flagellar biosynthesis sigma factor n=1 Tax=Aquisphaera giovannonii TaxID=406548 RepID=A0A5B9W5Z8_9BACT|nr:sigma-70 family RNA polymerase sigma factor [Aquisphaera giovannonii]QEH35401.1 flagellar biosynthesis sigma factor [Aquisphaera giovannonii]